MVADRSSTPSSVALAVIEAVMLRTAFEHIDDNLLAVEEHALSHDDDGHELLAGIASDLRRRIARELAHVDDVLTRSLKP